MVKLLLWTLVWLVMWFFAIAGTLCAGLAAVSFFVDLSPVVSLALLNEPVRTPQQKAMFLGVSGVLAGVGIGFLWLRRRGYLRDPL
jgi:hypothetical protein